MSDARRNWAGNYSYNAARWHRPSTVAEVQDIVRRSDRVKALGTRHCFNGVADTTGDLVSLERLDQVLAIDRSAATVTIQAGVRYGELAQQLQAAGLALHNLASLPHISVAGAVATATHGSGDGNGNLATAVSALELVTADGELLSLARETDPERFPATVVALGALGLVTSLTLRTERTYQVRQEVFLDLPITELDEKLDAIMAGGYSVSLLTDWRSGVLKQLWRKSRVEQEVPNSQGEGSWFGAIAATSDVHPLAGMPAANCTPQRGLPGQWHERLPHFRLEFTPSAGEELQSEYFVARKDARAALAAIQSIAERVAAVLQGSEIRTVAADDYWLSPCYQRDSLAIHFTWKPDWDGVLKVLPLVEEHLAPFSARPHWGKLFTMEGARLASLYDRLDDFRALARTLDPNGKCRNTFLERYVFGDEECSKCS